MTVSYPLNDILNKAPAIIYISDNATKTIRWCNRYFEKFTGYNLKGMNALGKNFFRAVMHPDDFPRAEDAQNAFKNNQQASYFGDCRLKGRDHKDWKWVKGVAIPYSYDELGQIKEVICVFLNIEYRIDTPIQTEKALHSTMRRIHNQEIQQFTPKEKEVLALALTGYSEKMIAYKLEIRMVTVGYHLSNIRHKLNVPNMQALISKAKDLGL